MTEVVRVDGDPIALLEFLVKDCGADAYTFDGGEIVALKRDVHGNDVIVKRYPFQQIPQRKGRH